MQLFENFAKDSDYDSAVRSICTDKFAWHYPQVGVLNETDPRKACFGHTLLGKHSRDWSAAPVLENIFDEWQSNLLCVAVDQLIRCRINLYTPGQTTRLHQDSVDEGTYSLLWYFSDSDGGTSINGEWIEHRPNRAVLFDSTLWHEPTPSTAPARITVNWIFQGAVDWSTFERL